MRCPSVFMEVQVQKGQNLQVLEVPRAQPFPQTAPRAQCPHPDTSVSWGTHHPSNATSSI